jgi:uncharacterized protein YlzI (FlbEa/FlbD family)
MIEIAARNGNGSFFLNFAEIESILEGEGDTSEIVMISDRRYFSIWSKEKVAGKINQFIFELDSNHAN